MEAEGLGMGYNQAITRLRLNYHLTRKKALTSLYDIVTGEPPLPGVAQKEEAVCP